MSEYVGFQTRRTTFYDDFKVADRIPVGELDGLVVERFTVEGNSLENIRLMFQPGGRSCPPGEYTRLIEPGPGLGGTFWMSDTHAEARDHLPFWLRCKNGRANRVLINGLGLGCIVHALLLLSDIEHIDIVERDHRVIQLTGKYYAEDPRVNIIQADAYEQCKRWPAGSHWDGAWHDIWPDMSEDRLPEMAKLHRSYGRRVGFQMSWGRDTILAERRRTKDAWWRS